MNRAALGAILAAGFALSLAARPAEVMAAPPLPAGARPAGDDTYVSPRGLRETIRHYTRQLARRGAAHEAIPLYRVRGVEIARFIARDDGLSWLAIHVYRHQGTTFIAIIPRPP